MNIPKLKKKIYFTVFKSVIGSCGISWSNKGIVEIKIPQRLIKKRYIKDTIPPQWVCEVIEKIKKHMEGEIQDFSDVPLDLKDILPFYLRVYKATRTIPSGQTKTYGDIAKHIQSPKAARAVGQALGRNPIGLIIPCHRVVACGQKLGGFSAFGGPTTKAKLLSIEGVAML